MNDPMNVPDDVITDPRLRATLCTGQSAVTAVLDNLLHDDPRPVAVDIETAGLGADSFTVRCVTLAWDADDGMTYSVLLDPRVNGQKRLVADALEHAGLLVFHNGAFDLPPLYYQHLMKLEHVGKVWDTIVAARLGYPDVLESKGLEALADRRELLGMAQSDATMKDAFTSYGVKSSDGFKHMDIDSPVYRLGAMADTVVTLRLAPVLVNRVTEYLSTNPIGPMVVPNAATNPAAWFHGLAAPHIPDVNRALELLEREQTTFRTMARRSMLGLRVDTDYLETYRNDHAEVVAEAEADLEREGLDPESGALGKDLVTLLESRGELPDNWPRTATGQLSAAKKDMAKLEDHPLVVAQQQVATLAKVGRYLEKVSAMAAITGRVHPQVGILGASATGRMSYREPELQQFPNDARGILIPDDGDQWVSIDWSSIEPVVLANCAGDTQFLAEFNVNPDADLYAPIMEAAGVSRKVAKVVVLAAMYGQGRQLLATNLTDATGTPHTTDDAGRIQGEVFAAMPMTDALLKGLLQTGEAVGCTMTADGRRLPVPVYEGRPAGYKATNYFTQGSAYSVLSDTVNRVEHAGLGQSIQLAMHDELVVSAGAADDIRAIMETAPDWLVNFCGHTPVLRTDAQPLLNPEKGWDGRWRYI